MRVMTIVEAVLALSIGAGGGFGFLFATGEMKTGGQLSAMRHSVEAEERRVDSERSAEKMRQELAAKEAADKARLAAAAAAEAEKAARVQAASAAAAAAAAALPKYGVLVIKALNQDVVVDNGAEHKEGKVVELEFNDLPGKIKVKAGKFNLVLNPKIGARNTMGLDVSVSPLAIIKADGIAKGTSAPGLDIGRTAFKLDFSSPASGELNLILQYKK